MAEQTTISSAEEKIYLHESGGSVLIPAAALGVIGLAVALGVTALMNINPGFGRFYHAYLVSWAFITAIALGSLVITLIMHVFRAGWVVSVRRIFETLASTLPVLALLSLPILWTVFNQDGLLYPWAVRLDNATEAHASLDSSINPLPIQFADAEGDAAAHAAASDSAAHHADASHGAASHDGEHHAVAVGHQSEYGVKDTGSMTRDKRWWLEPYLFVARVLIYFGVFSFLARWVYNSSRKSDETGDPEINKRLSKWAPIGIIVFAFSTTGFVFDVLMSLDHHWYSTMYGVYFFAGAMISAFASTIVIVNVLHRTGFLTRSVNVEHLHDLGKLMFTFIFFWGYVGFSQYMLQWYANVPEEIYWWARRGANLSSEQFNGSVPQGQYGAVLLVLLFGHLLIPFGVLLSRHIKRNKELLLLAAVWMVFMCWLDIYWMVMPELNNGVFYLGVPEVACAIGLIGLFVALVTWKLSRAPLRPLKDPRLPEALAFHNM